MDPKLKRKWLAALRSGKYLQGRNRLRRGNRFCCLGVLADVAGCDWITPDCRYMGIPVLQGKELSASGTYLDNRRPFKGITQTIQKRLSILNDGDLYQDEGDGIKPQSFKQIAEWIRVNL